MSYRVPDPPTLSDKLADWEVLAAAGGDSLFVGKDVLDVGPLYGLEALIFAAKAKSYVVLDCSEAVLVRQPPMAERRFWDITHTPWPFEGESFDTVLDLSTFDDTDAPETCYLEAARILRPGGLLITAFANARVILPSDEWITQHPDTLAPLHQEIGFGTVRGWRLDQARAHMVAEKGL